MAEPVAPPEITLVEAVNLALARALDEDERVVVFGEDVGVNGGVFRATVGLQERFGARRVMDTPLAENLICGIAVGMAAQGLRPVAEIQFMGFIYPALDQLLSHASRLRNRTRGRLACPMVLRAPYGGGIRAPEHHSESTEAMLAHIPGLRVVVPSSPARAYGLLLSAIRDPDPVVFLEPKRIYRLMRQAVPDDGAGLPLDAAFVLREGRDVTLVAWGAMIHETLEAAERLAAEGVSAEVIDLATLRPLDMDTVLASVGRTGRCVIVHEAARTAGLGAEIAAGLAEEGLLSLLAPVRRVTGYDTVMPLPRLERHYLPGVDRIVAAAREVLEGGAGTPAPRAAAPPAPPPRATEPVLASVTAPSAAHPGAGAPGGGAPPAPPAGPPAAATRRVAFRLPDVGEGLQEAEIVEWHVAEGDTVRADQPLVSVETDKAVVDIPSPHAGRVARIAAGAGDVVPVGAVLVELEVEGAAGAGAAEAGRADAGAVVGEVRAGDEVVDEAPTTVGPAPLGVKATPAVRALAARHGIDLAVVTPSGPDGTVTAADVERVARIFAELGPIEVLHGPRRAMARRMAIAHAEVVPTTVCEDADVSAWAPGTDVTMRLVRAMVAGCRAEPSLNAWYDTYAVGRRVLERIDVGIAFDTEAGLFVPVLRDAGGRDAEDLRAGLERLKADVRSRSIPPEEMRGYTIMLSNFGMIAGRYATPVVLPPCVAILGAGRIAEAPAIRDGTLVARRLLPLSLTFDHRAVTGGEAARFLRAAVADLEAA